MINLGGRVLATAAISWWFETMQRVPRHRKRVCDRIAGERRITSTLQGRRAGRYVILQAGT